jgi:putative tryptophan/tyrosine transport system substrate-binding protein
MDGVTPQLKWIQRRKNYTLRLSLLVCLLFSCSTTTARTLLLLSGNATYYQETAQSLQTNAVKLGIPNDQFDVLTVEEFNHQHTNQQPISKPYELIVAVGSVAATDAVQHKGKVPLLNIFIPKNAFDSIYSEEAQQSSRKVSAIYLDQPSKRFITLACLLKPEVKEFGTIFGPISKTIQPEIEQLTTARGINLNYAFLSKEDNPITALKPVVTASGLFIAIPDHAILNRAVARWILHLGFQHKIPVIGFSNAYTNAGAIASVYTAPENIGKHAAELIASWLQNTNSDIWSPRYPRYYTLSTNPAVARSLGIPLPKEKELYTKFRRMEEMENDK